MKQLRRDEARQTRSATRDTVYPIQFPRATTAFIFQYNYDDKNMDEATWARRGATDEEPYSEYSIPSKAKRALTACVVQYKYKGKH